MELWQKHHGPSPTLPAGSPPSQPPAAHSSPTPPAASPGAGSQVTPAERREIQRQHLAEGLNQKQIAAQTGRTRETIAAQLKGADFERIRTAVEADLIETVKRQLTNNVDKAANAWIKALDRAAQKGDHKPAKDLLMHAGVIDPLGETSRPQFVVVVGMPGHPAMIPPSQEVIDAEKARVLALRAPSQQAANRAGRTCLPNISTDGEMSVARRFLASIDTTLTDQRSGHDCCILYKHLLGQFPR